MSLFKERLKQIMRSKSVRQIDVVAETGIPKAAISNYLAGRYEPTGERLYVLADFFGVSPAWLKGYSDNLNDNVINEETLDKVNSTDPALIEKYNGDLDAAYAEQQRIDQINNGSLLDILSNKDKELLNDYLKLNELGKDKAIDYVKDLASVEKYTK